MLNFIFFVPLIMVCDALDDHILYCLMQILNHYHPNSALYKNVPYYCSNQLSLKLVFPPKMLNLDVMGIILNNSVILWWINIDLYQLDMCLYMNNFILIPNKIIFWRWLIHLYNYLTILILKRNLMINIAMLDLCQVAICNRPMRTGANC